MLAERARVDPQVIYLSARQPGWDQPPEWFARSHGYSSEVLGGWQRARPGRAPVVLPRGIGRALGRARPRCVVTWEYGPSTWLALAWARRSRVPVVIFSELTLWSDAELSALQRRVHRVVAPRAAGFIAASSQGAERLRRLGIPAERIEVALQSADLAGFAAAATERRPTPAERPVRVLAIGRLVPDKNLAELVHAFAEAGFGPGEAELEVRGTGPLEAELRGLADRLGVPASFPGTAPAAELPKVYAAADVVALVSGYEPFGVTLREAAAAGLALLASRRAGAVGDVAVHDENALVIDPGERAELTAALRRVVRDSDLRARLAAGSLAITERHPPEADAEAWERAIEKAAGTPESSTLKGSDPSTGSAADLVRPSAAPRPRGRGA